ncbi:hypothetical protein EMIHUDRAFT_471530, partial [Emiliania huxleyi CCMP1516]|uniref:Protein kinase domain-containing protein n=2 Tax=Emiliania huxleyi TaxID=2903 RepID=A0A0D3KLD8_EMIH1
MGLFRSSFRDSGSDSKSSTTRAGPATIGQVTPATSGPATPSTSSADSVVDNEAASLHQKSMAAVDSEILSSSSARLRAECAALGWEAGALEVPAAGRTPFADFRQHAKLASGEFCDVSAAVFRGSDGLTFRVGVKVLKAGRQVTEIAVSDLRREAAVLARLRHPHVVCLVAFGEHPNGMPFYAMELFEATLSAVLPRKPKEAKAGYRILHRDIKPGNIGLAAGGRVVLADFGLLKLWKRGGEAEDTPRALTGMTGALRYMAPEAEVFSFTSLLYQLLAHQKPFAWMNAEQFLAE